MYRLLCCYADDSTYSVSSDKPEELQLKINTQYANLSDYMANNKLVLNSEKTHVLVMTSMAKHKKFGDFGVKLNTGTEMILPIQSEKLLGCIVSNDMKWNLHINDADRSMIQQLKPRINALRLMSPLLSFKNRKMIAQGIIMSNLCYLIQLYGCAGETLLSMLQVVQNSAARLVTRLPWYTAATTNLNQCGWLSVRQMAALHSLLLLRQIRHDTKPAYLYNRIRKDFQYETRLASNAGVPQHMTFRTEYARNSFINRTTRL